MSGSSAVLLTSDLEEAERLIQDFIYSYERAGQALLDIHERELWRELDSHDSFEDYVEQRWKWKKSQAWRLVSAGKFVRALSQSPIGESHEKFPTSESLIRPLMAIKADTEDNAWGKRVECWQVVLDQSAKDKAEITAKYVTSVVNRFYRGGDVVKPPREVRLGDYTNAFTVIADSGLSPEEAIERFGSPDKWSGFEEALAWMEEAAEHG